MAYLCVLPVSKAPNPEKDEKPDEHFDRWIHLSKNDVRALVGLGSASTKRKKSRAKPSQLTSECLLLLKTFASGILSCMKE